MTLVQGRRKDFGSGEHQTKFLIWIELKSCTVLYNTMYTSLVYNVQDIMISVMYNFAERIFTFNFQDWNKFCYRR